MKAAAAIVVLAAWSASPRPAAAWGGDAHLIVCEIALRRLSTQGRAFLDAVRAHEAEIGDPFRHCADCAPAHPDDGRSMSFQEGCLWPDEARTDTFKGTYEYHFLDVPAAAASLDPARDCGRLDCVLAGIQRYAQYLAAPPTASSRDRERHALALRFVSHFVADLHQPLHVADAEDLGGNLIEVRLLEDGEVVSRSLHAVWDVSVLRRAGLTPGDAPALNAEITAAEAAAWSELSIVDWARESHALARQRAYVKPDGSRVQDGELLDADYFARAIDAARLQVKRAGVRLAALIEAAAAGKMPPDLVTLAP